MNWTIRLHTVLGSPVYRSADNRLFPREKGTKHTHTNFFSYLLSVEECKQILYNIAENAIEITAVVLTMSAALAMLCVIPVGERTLVTMAIQLQNSCNHGNRI